MFNQKFTYLNLPENFYQRVKADYCPSPKLIKLNNELLEQKFDIKLNHFNEKELANIFTGQTLLNHSIPIAQAYAGHQFGHFNPSLGDGRALLLGEITSDSNLKNEEEKLYDVVLKGSGRTPFSRSGDGKSPLGPAIREYIVSEAMYYFGVPTTRALAICSTGEKVYREDPLDGAIFTRLASSHIRVGTFEYFASRHEFNSVEKLVKYSLERHFKNHKLIDQNIYLTFINEVAKVQSNLISNWMSFGFIHGVMNTDNMSISGETIDFGPCAFMDTFSNDQVYSFIDKQGRYAYGNQIKIAIWNLYRLAECLIPLVDSNTSTAVSLVESLLKKIEPMYHQKWLNRMLSKLGIEYSNLNKEILEQDEKLINDWLSFLEKEKLDFTISFRTLLERKEKFHNSEVFQEIYKSISKKHLLNKKNKDLDKILQETYKVNPIYIPRNHQVEKAIEEAYQNNFVHFEKLLEVSKKPFINQGENFSMFENPPLQNEIVKNTFCGT